MTAKIQIRRDTISNWSGASPTANLSAGEIGVAFTAAGDVHGIKIGPSGGGNWNSLPYLSGTLPDLDVAGITSWNDNALRTTGRFILNSNFATDGPSGSIAFVADDGRITCMSVAFGTSHLHIVTTEGNSAATPTAVPAKMLFRIYDGNAATPAWRDWTPLSLWSSSATTGVDITAKSITLKDTATGLTVDGNSVLTGNVTVNGTTTLGNANADIVTVQAGLVGAPIITTAGDTDTGIYFPAANEFAITTGGANAVQFNSAQAVTFFGALAANLNCGNFKLTSLANATAGTDALNLNSLLDRIAIIAPSSAVGTAFQASNGSSWELTNLTNPRWTAAAGGNYDGIIIAIDGNGNWLSAYCRSFYNQPSPIDGQGPAAYTALIAIRRS